MKEYHYLECGLDNIYLINGFEFREEGEVEEIFIHNLQGLHKAILMSLATMGRLLSGKEVIFIRHFLDLSQKAFGRILGVDYQTVLRWEKGKKGSIPKITDRFIKTLVLAYLDKENHIDVYNTINELADLDEKDESHTLKFQEIANQWLKTA